ncbi:cohesin domain-containing protein [bacterium]|nr:cohesin domain-containing protein [bacterium]
MKRNLCLVLLAVLLVVPVMAVDESKIDQAKGDRLWISSVDAVTGDQITVDLMLENAMTEVDAVTITLKYDASKLQFVDWADGTLDPGWVMFNINEKNNGEISLGGFCVKTAIKPGSKGSLARLNFKVKGEAGTYSYISFDKIRDDIAAFNYENGKIKIKGSGLKK